MYDDDRYDSLLDFLHDGKSPVKREILESSCLVMPEATYQRTRELKRLQRRLANLQIANAAFRESWGIRVMSQLRSKLLRKPYPFDEIRDLTHRVTQEEAELRQIIDPLEMSDARFQEYKPCGDQYIRVRPDTSPVLAQRFFGHPRPAAIKPVLERFKSVWDNFRDLQPDPRILGFIAILGATSDFDAEEFRTWDERVLGMLYGPDATPSHPLTHDRFLIHAILYGLPTGAVSDRYIGFRIGWELFRKTWTRHFEHQLRALVSAAYLLRTLEPFPTEEAAFRGFYQHKLERYRTLMRSIHHRSRAPDQQMGRGVKISGGDDAGFDSGGTGGGASILEGVSLGTEARIGIPDPVFIAAARLVGLQAPVNTIHRHLSEMLLTFDKLSDPMQIACVLTDTPLYFMDRRDKKDSFRPDEPGTFASQLRERTREVSQVGRHLPLKGLHAALIALQPGPVKDSIEIFADLYNRLQELPESARRLVTCLLMDGVIPSTRHRRFAYEIWFSEGMG